MSLRVVLTIEAEADFDSAADWYEQNANLGEAFTMQVRKVLNQVAKMPELHREIYKDIRRV